jgi:YHS domain-containing protein
MLRVILVLVLITLLGRAFWRLVDGIVEGVTGTSRLPRQRRGAVGGTESVQMSRDPVCGTFVVPDRAVTLTDGAKRVYFCSTACRDKYRARTA